VKYESEKKTTGEMLELYNVKCTNAEEKLIKAQQIIADLESTIVLIRQENVKSLKDIEGMFNLQYIKYKKI